MPLQPKRRRIINDNSLLHVFLAAAVVVSFSIILVPLDIESSSAQTNAHPFALKPSSRQHLPIPHTDNESNDALEKLSLQGKSNREASLLLSETTPRQQMLNEHKVESKIAYHTVFSSGCSTFQDWQSYVFFFHLLQSGQEGHVTRIASGCSEKEEEILKGIFEREIKVMAPDRFHLHLTPDYSDIKPGIKFKYFNKPCGMRHWMEEGLGFPDNRAEHDDTVYILLDPDQILTRSFTNDFTYSSEKWRLKDGYKHKVEHGSPFSQQYGYGLQWKRKVNLTTVFPDGTPITNMTDKEAFDYYMGMGPPYIATGKDMYTIVSTWSEIVPRVHDEYPHLLAEMFGYNLAAAHHGLRHTVAHSFMVSDVKAGGEGWKLIDAVPADKVCHDFPESELPHALHYCQRYYLGKWFIGKYRLRKDFISCDSPLLKMPPFDIALKYDFAITPDDKRVDLSPRHVKEEAFMVCAMIKALNDAAIYFKDHHCDKESANYAFSYVFHDNMTIPTNKPAA